MSLSCCTRVNQDHDGRPGSHDPVALFCAMVLVCPCSGWNGVMLKMRRADWAARLKSGASRKDADFANAGLRASANVKGSGLDWIELEGPRLGNGNGDTAAARYDAGTKDGILVIGFGVDVCRRGRAVNKAKKEKAPGATCRFSHGDYESTVAIGWRVRFRVHLSIEGMAPRQVQ
ncbi:uncharacterized protein CC84DRAFT_440110 [Paraphaeosphaeria sporulosa]|uniref:Uncharacterized protein n=1 Tax=Paraphaeosphaeria sporulosa TaxID=1460663 RepID=A0A177CQM1_9PLEO|nr:uncharacterized protein CC84DRAFT_440110 [Paraphaeosphaeria sporulosa]OAG09521.1 hypothetical protein CC84DRAFT_440110 [Paraphaeosphaeria sporulosa]